MNVEHVYIYKCPICEEEVVEQDLLKEKVLCPKCWINFKIKMEMHCWEEGYIKSKKEDNE